jgi:hypothetical protein
MCLYITYRVLVKHISKFKSQSKMVSWHIPHEYSFEMAKKSTVVSIKATHAIISYAQRFLLE